MMLAKKYGFSPRDVKELRIQFGEVDQDGSGEIDLDEFEDLCLGTNIIKLESKDRDYLAELLDKFDNDGSGTINFDEFLEIVSPRRSRFVAHKEKKMQKVQKDSDRRYMRMQNAREKYIWNRYSRYQQQVWRLAVKLGYDQKNFVRHMEMFNSFDDDGSGEIDLDELRQACRALKRNLTEEELREEVRKFDWQRVGRINFEGFLEMMSPRRLAHLQLKRKKADHLAESMKNERARLDASKQRRKKLVEIREKEKLAKWARKLGLELREVEEMRAIFDANDADGSGQIDLDEFSDLLIDLRLPQFQDASRDDLKRIMDEYDQDKSATIDFYEFLQIVSPRRQKFYEQQQGRLLQTLQKRVKNKQRFDGSRYRAAVQAYSQHQERLFRWGTKMGFSNAIMNRLLQRFQEFDVDGSETLSASESLSIAKEDLGRGDLTLAEMREMIEEHDRSGLGAISFTDFANDVSKARKGKGKVH